MKALPVSRLRQILKPFSVVLGLLVLWQLLVSVSAVPHYILPGPARVFQALSGNGALLLEHSLVTLTEMIIGLLAGSALGLLSALSLSWYRPLRAWLLPVLVISQAIPVFALAPVLMLWFGFGMASKIVMTTLIIYFPVTVACFDGLRHTPQGWLDLASVMGANRPSQLLRIRLPAALPALGSGLRVATSVAPIGAVVGEWVGSSEGLGYLMLHASARMQVDLMFAALLVLAVLAVALYFLVDGGLRRAMPWQRVTL